MYEVSYFEIKDEKIAVKDATARANAGDLEELSTVDKSTLVAAINELQGIVSTLQSGVFPIGHIIYNSDCETEAEVLARYGGVHWERILDTFIAARGETFGESGGADSVTLTMNNIPAHAHDFSASAQTSTVSTSHAHNFTTDSAGGHQHAASNVNTHNFVSAGGSGFGGSSGTVTTTNATLVKTSQAGAHTHTGTTDVAAQSHEHNVTVSGTTTNAGASVPTAINITPTYIGAYAWRRVE